jgi:hypothetical protein
MSEKKAHTSAPKANKQATKLKDGSHKQ